MCRAVRPNRALPWARRGAAVGPHTLEMQRDGALDATECRIDGLTRRDAAREVGDRRSPVAVGLFVEPDEILNVLHDAPGFRPACRSTEASVPFGISSPGCPLMVTRPGFT